jgi:RNA polymerase sigma-70 factor, ECF subfamily
MHAAPPVRMKLASEAGWRAFVVVVAAAAAANLASWLAALADATALPAIAISMAACALGAAVAWRAVWQGGDGILNWDGADWSWAPDSQEPATGTLHVTIDLGAWMLLRFAPANAPRRVTWLAASRRQAAGAWPRWRAALLARRPNDEPPDTEPDAILVERTKGGDVKAFEMLVVKYQRRIERLIGRMVRDVDLVQDIAQETFIRAYRAIPQFRGESAFYTWLYRIAVNTAKKSLVELKRDPLVSEAALVSHDDGDETSRTENELSDGETPESLLASKQVAGTVNAAIDALSEDLRQAIVLREIEGLSYEEIAAVMNCPIGTVRSRIFRAREAIAERLRPLLGTRDDVRW